MIQNENYNSRSDTLAHIAEVRSLLDAFSSELHVRGTVHDASKLEEPEKSVFDTFTPKLRGSTYGSDEYKQFLVEMQVALDHHYKHNSHHPEHYPNGVDDMTLWDIVEMFCDWHAATKRHNDGDLLVSIEKNTKRFNLSPQLVSILRNTVLALRGKGLA